MNNIDSGSTLLHGVTWKMRQCLAFWHTVWDFAWMLIVNKPCQ